MLAAAQAAAAAGNAKLTVFDADRRRPPRPSSSRTRPRPASTTRSSPSRSTGPASSRTSRRRSRRASRRQHRPGPRRRHDHPELAGRGPQRERRVRPERARSQDRRARGRGLRRPQGQPVQRRLHLVGQGRRARHRLKAAFDTAIASHPEIKVVADSGESFYTTAARPEGVAGHRRRPSGLSVIVSADQAITGAVVAVKDIKDKVRLVGYGGGAIALQGIASGERFGTVMQMPATEGRLGTEQLINAIRTGTPAPGVDPLASLPGRRRRHQGQRRPLPAARGVAGLTTDRSGDTWPCAADDAVHLEVRGLGKSFGATRALDDVSIAVRAGLGPRVRRRERRRQVHARQDHRGGLPAGPGRPGPARDDRSRSLPARGPRQRDRAGRPGGRPRPPADRRAERVPRHRAAARRVHRPAGDARAVRAARRGRGLRPPGRHDGRSAAARPAAAGRDPPRARPGGGPDRPRRADREPVGAETERLHEIVRGLAVARPARSSSSRTSSARSSTWRTRSRSCATAASSGPARPPRDRGEPRRRDARPAGRPDLSGQAAAADRTRRSRCRSRPVGARRRRTSRSSPGRRDRRAGRARRRRADGARACDLRRDAADGRCGSRRRRGAPADSRRASLGPASR